MKRFKRLLVSVLTAAMVLGSVPVSAAEPEALNTNVKEIGGEEAFVETNEDVLFEAEGDELPEEDGLDEAVLADQEFTEGSLIEENPVEEVLIEEPEGSGGVYPLWIGGVQVTGETAENFDCGGGVYAKFDYNDGDSILTFIGSGILRAKQKTLYLVSSNGIDLTIEGNVRMSENSNCSGVGIYCNNGGNDDKGDLTINAGLQIENFVTGIWSNGSITINNNVEGYERNEMIISDISYKTADIILYRSAYDSGKSITFKGDSDVYMSLGNGNNKKTEQNAVYAVNADIIIEEDLSIRGDFSTGIETNKAVKIENAEVNIDIDKRNDDEKSAIYCEDDITVRNSHVNAEVRNPGNVSAIRSKNGKVDIYDSYIRASAAGNAPAIYGEKNIKYDGQRPWTTEIVTPKNPDYEGSDYKYIIDKNTGKPADEVILNRNFGLYVGNTLITAENANRDIKVAGGTARFIAGSGTLSFNGTVTGVTGMYNGSLISWDPSEALSQLTISAAPEGSLSLKSSEADKGIYVTDSDSLGSPAKLYLDGNINIETTKEGSNAIRVYSTGRLITTEVKANSSVSLKSKGAGITGFSGWSKAPTGICVKGKANLNVTSDDGNAIYVSKLEIEGGTVYARSGSRDAVSLYAYSNGLYPDKLLFMDGGSLTAETTATGDVYAATIEMYSETGTPYEFKQGETIKDGYKFSETGKIRHTMNNQIPARKVRINNVTEYGLWVGEVEVTSLNKDNIPVQGGSAKYDNAANILTLRKVTGVNGYWSQGLETGNQTALIYNSKIENLTIDVTNSTLESDTVDYGILSMKPITIRGNGKALTMKALKSAVNTNNSTLNIAYGIFDLSGEGTAAIISGALNYGDTSAEKYSLRLTAKGSGYAVYARGSITGADSYAVISPEGATPETITGSPGYYGFKTGDSWCKEVTLGSTFYDIWVNGNRLRESEKEGFLGTDENRIGYSYDDSTKTLTLSSPLSKKGVFSTEGSIKGASIIYAQNMDLVVKTVGPVNPASSLTYKADINLSSVRNSAVRVKKGSLTLEGSIWYACAGSTSAEKTGILADNITIEGSDNKGGVYVDINDLDTGHTACGIYAADTFTMNSSGTLSVNVINPVGAAYGIKAGKDIILNNGRVYAAAGNSTIDHAPLKADNGTIISRLNLVKPVKGFVRNGVVWHKVGKNTVPAPEVVYEGKMEDVYTVTFTGAPHSSENYQTVTVKKGRKVSRPAGYRTADGYRFDDWYADDACTTKFDFENTAIERDTVVHAHYFKELSVIFDRNGHGYAPSKQEILEGDKAVRPKKPDNDGDFKFVDWYTAPECKDDELYDFNTPVTSDITLFAKWAGCETYTVTFNLNKHGDESKKPSVQSVKEGHTAANPTPTEDKYPADANFSFVGWYRNAAGTVRYDFTTPVTSDLTLYARWVKKGVETATVTFDLNEVDADPVAAQVIEKGKKAVEPEAPAANAGTGKRFVAWYTKKIITADDKPFDFKKTAINENITLFANWASIGNGMQVSFGDDVSHSGGRYIHYYTSYKIEPGINVTDGYGHALVKDLDYTVKYSNNINVDKNGKPAVVTIKGKGNYKDTKKLLFYILPKSLGDGTVSGNMAPDISISLTSENKILVKEKASVVPVISYADYQLKSKDYTVVLSNGGRKFVKTDPNPTVDIIGRGNFSGIIKGVPVNVIDNKAMKTATIKVMLANAGNIAYDGSRKTLSKNQLIVKDGDNKNELTLNKDYTVRYVNNVNAGNAQVIVTGKGNYTGSVTKKFKILPDKTSRINADIPTAEKSSIIFNKNGVTPTVEVYATRGSKVRLTEGVDYKLTYSNNKKVSTDRSKAKYTVKFIGNYKGQKNIQNQFTILPAKFDVKVIADHKVAYNSKAAKYISKPYVILNDGRNTLLNTKYYTVASYKIGAEDITKKAISVSGNKAVDVTVSGKGDYTAVTVSASSVYKIKDQRADTKYDLSKAKIYAKGTTKAVGAQQYTSQEIEPEIEVWAKPAGGKALEKVDKTKYPYEVTYFNNVDKGTAYILVTAKDTAKNEIVGSCTAKFKIGARGFEDLFQVFR